MGLCCSTQAFLFICSSDKLVAWSVINEKSGAGDRYETDQTSVLVPRRVGLSIRPNSPEGTARLAHVIASGELTLATYERN
jgi:hypothetical protein